MECRTVAGMLSEYVESLDGKRTALTASEQKAVGTHLQKCAGCRGLQGELQEIRLAARELPVHTPPASLWTRIANQIEIEQAGSQAKAPASAPPSWWERLRRQTFIFSLPQMAGAAALALILLSVTIYQFNNARQGTPEIDFTRLQGALLREETSKRAEIERKLAAINEQKGNWDPERRADFDRQMNKIEASLKQCQEQLARDPNDLTQVQKMLDLYEEKRQLLEDVERLN